MLHLAFGERALLADEMGLGKTIQAIAACELLARRKNVDRVLVVCPASLKAEWEEQIARFTERPARSVFCWRRGWSRLLSPRLRAPLQRWSTIPALTLTELCSSSHSSPLSPRACFAPCCLRCSP